MALSNKKIISFQIFPLFPSKKTSLTLIAILSFAVTFGQVRFSVATDFGFQRSFKKEQQYWAVGHTVHTLFHLTPKDAAYIWISYYSEGRFHNDLTATAKSVLTVPQQINFRNNAAMRFKHFSIGWKRYLRGVFDSEEKWMIYGYGGFGLMLGRVINSHEPGVDTAAYDVPVKPGKANFKRLTLDLGLGWETPLGADIFFYAEGRVWIPTTDYPSTFIFVNNNAPLTGMANVGLRILF